MTHTTIFDSGDPEDNFGLVLHVDHIHKSDETHIVFYDTDHDHDTEGWMLSKERAIELAQAILKSYGVE